MESKTSILMFPWIAHGHISPFLELAKKLSKRNFLIYLCSTPANLVSVKPKIDEKFSLSIKLVELHLPALPDLPPCFHTTNGLPPHLMFTLKDAFDMSNQNFSDILETLKPDLLIYDFLQPWAPATAAAHNIPAVEFITSSATMTSLMLHVFNDPDKDFPFSDTVYFRDNERAHLDRMIESARNQHKKKNPAIECLKQSNNIVLIKSFKEIEGKYCDYLSLLAKKKLVPVGPVVQEPVCEEQFSDIIEWLNKKDHGSTVFVSFGSEYFLKKEDITEIAHGLELSNVNFIWVLRFPKGEKLAAQETLPLGFLDRVGERGMVVEGWAPQARILGHPSTGGFASHCGWGSVIESMSFGIPIIAMPMHLDQPINARVVEEVGIGVEATRDITGKLKREKIAAVIREVVVETEGEGVRKKARKMRDDIRIKGEEEIDNVVLELLQLCKKK